MVHYPKLFTFLLLYCSIGCNTLLTASNELSELKKILEQQNVIADRDSLANIYGTIGELHASQSQNAEALSYFQKGLDLVLNAPSNAPASIAYFHLKLGNSYTQLSNFPEAIEHYNQATIIGAYDSDANEDVIYAWIGIGNIYLHVGDYEQAYSHHLKAIELSNKNANLVYSYYTLGNIYFHQKRMDKALKCYQQSLEIAIQEDDKRWMYTCYDAIGVTYGKKKNFEKWVAFSQLAIETAKESNYELGVAYGTHNLAGYYATTKCYDEALAYYQEALYKMQVAKDQLGEAKVLRSLGKSSVRQKSYKEAIVYLKQALEIANGIGVKPLIQEIYQLLYQSYHHQSQPLLAYQYQDKYITLSDSLTKANNNQRIWSMQIRHKLQNKEATIDELEQAQKINQLYPRASLVGISVLLLMGFLLLNNNRLERIRHELLEQRNLQSEKERELLAQSNQSLEYFATIASNDLQMPLDRIDDLIQQVERDCEADLYNDGKLYIYYISDGIKRMTNLLTDLLSYAKMDSRKTNWKLMYCPIPKLLEDVQHTLVNAIEEKDAQIVVENLPQRIVANPTTLALLFQNLISNAIKFVGDRVPMIHISCKTTPKEYVFSIQDNGIGIAPEYQERIFEIFQRLHTNSEYKGTGIGLATCQKIVKRHKGKIWLTSEEGLGTTFYFSISRRLIPSRTISVLVHHS